MHVAVVTTVHFVVVASAFVSGEALGSYAVTS